ncbi:MAG: SAM-dependent methyltransferase, partial [Ferruginibacter sp.]
MNCRHCKNELSFEFADLGFSPPSNAFLTMAQLNEPETFYPLKTMVCEKCFLV